MEVNKWQCCSEGDLLLSSQGPGWRRWRFQAGMPSSRPGSVRTSAADPTHKGSRLLALLPSRAGWGKLALAQRGNWQRARWAAIDSTGTLGGGRHFVSQMQTVRLSLTSTANWQSWTSNPSLSICLSLPVGQITEWKWGGSGKSEATQIQAVLGPMQFPEPQWCQENQMSGSHYVAGIAGGWGWSCCPRPRAPLHPRLLPGSWTQKTSWHGGSTAGGSPLRMCSWERRMGAQTLHQVFWRPAGSGSPRLNAIWGTF